MALPTWTPPGEFDEYRLVKPLGHGSMGQVWLAQDTLLDRRVAIKFIGVLTSDVGARERFLAEARAIARLAHPNVVGIHRVGAIHGQPYMVTEFINGHSLDKLDRPVPGETVLSIGIDLARGLAAAHRAGVLHRDLKPANAILTGGRARLLDFGLAKAVLGEEPLSQGGSVPAPALAATSLDPNATMPGEARQLLNDDKITPQSLTANGAVVGTPLYLAPECWRGEGATRRSDVYSLGALLYELSAGRPPARFLPPGELRTSVQAHDVPPLCEVRPGVDARLGAIIDRCLGRDPGTRFASGDELREALERVTDAPASLPPGNPYRGLLVFEAEHRAMFHGRRDEIGAVLERLRGNPLVVVAGESGTGKSSLGRAGVLPGVADGALGGGRAWTTLALLPGATPLRALAGAGAELLSMPEAALYARLLDEPDVLAREVARELGTTRGAVFFVDQFEQWLPHATEPAGIAAARALAALASGVAACRVLATARTDLLTQLAALPGIGPSLSSSLFLLGPIEAERLKQVIEQPALDRGARFESPELVGELAAFAAQRGALPLLQFALARLWDQRDGATVLTRAMVDRLGGVAGALSHHADGLFERLPSDQRVAAREVVLGLVSGQNQRVQRLETDLVALAPDARTVLTTLERERLVLACDSPDGTMWELAHDALLHESRTISGWLVEDVESRLASERVTAAASGWARLDFASEALWGDKQLRSLTGVTLAPLHEAEQSFLKASRRRARLQRWRWPSLAVALVAVGAATWGAIVQVQRAALSKRVDVLLDRSRRARTQSDAHQTLWSQLSASAWSRFDEGSFATGEEAWSRAVEARDAWLEATARARAEVANAFALQPERAEVRAVLVDASLEALELAHARRDESTLDAELSAVMTLAPTDPRIERFAPRGVVVSEVVPPNASVQLTRLVHGVAEPRAWAPRVTLPTGSYVLSATLEGFAEAHLPFEVLRGEALSLELKLLRRDAVPAGFVYVPGGPTWVGAGGDESVRREFYDAAPLHRRELPSFLIGRTEVTFAQWLAWLDTLPATERVLRSPRVVSALGTGPIAHSNLSVERTAHGWSFTYAPIEVQYSALAGQRLHYEDRAANAEQDWRNFPVVGVSPRDFEAYARWLDESGQVPGARLCTEQEWERAARGGDWRTLPMGELLGGPSDANLDVTYGRKERAFGLDEVGLHPASKSPFGIDDLLGNAWEIVRPLRVGDAEFTTKGGAWNVGLLSARIPNNWVTTPNYRQVESGSRICATATY